MSKVAVIGAGPLGLMAMKNLREVGFDVTGFEKRRTVGGLWNAVADGSISAMPATVFNSSRFRSAISDFPFDDGVGDFPTAPELQSYFESYCDHFHLRPHINFGVEVMNVQFSNDHWDVTYRKDGEDTKVAQFDRILVSTGSFTKPKRPEVKGIDKFKGQVKHSIEFHPQDYKGKNVMLIGLHATAQDITKELRPYASQVYISHKNGLVLLPRYGPDGKTFDTGMNMSFFFFQEFAQRYFPNVFSWLVDKLVKKMSQTAFPAVKPEWKFWPAPSMATTSPLIADDIWPHLESGFAEPVMGLSEVLDENTVKMDDGRIIKDLDAIIFCTGYNMNVPIVPPEYNPIPYTGAPPSLYQNIFPLHPNPAIRNSLAFLGLVGIPFPGFVQHELLGIAIGQVWKGAAPLPSLHEMQQSHKSQLAWRENLLRRQKTPASFYVLFVNMPPLVRWLDRTCGTGIFEHFGWFKWRAWRLWWQDKQFYNLLKSGTFTPAIWRYFDMGYGRAVWGGAKTQIQIDNLLADGSAKLRLARVEQKKLGWSEKAANGDVHKAKAV